MRYRKKVCSTVEMKSGELTLDEKLALEKCATYLLRHIKKYPTMSKEVLAFMSWVLGEQAEGLFDFFMETGDRRKLETIREAFDESDMSLDDFVDLLSRAYTMAHPMRQKGFKRFVRAALMQRAKQLTCRKPSPILKKIQSLGEMFAMSDIDIELCAFLFVAQTYDTPEYFFDSHLECCTFKGRKFITNLLDMSEAQLHRSVSKLSRYGLLEDNYGDFRLEDEIVSHLQKPGTRLLTSEFYTRCEGSALPLDAHSIAEAKRVHLLKLLGKRTKTPAHVIFYGPSGTGKTSLARRVGQELNLPAFEISANKDNKSNNRRAAIIACINMTQSKRGALIIVDEADNLLNTQMSWLSRGETCDKGWLNELLEKPWLRMIWITNTTDRMDGAVMRRFSFSIAFKPLNRHQRAAQWEQVLRQNRVKRYFSRDQIAAMATEYNVSAGVMDTAVRKAIDSGACSREEFQASITLGLDAYLELVHRGSVPVREKPVEKQFTLRGLNLSGNIRSILKQVEAFGDYLNRTKAELSHQMCLLFYGPPGAGKTEMARHIGHRLAREIHFKRFSELQSKYVGEGEKNIRVAFNRTQDQKSILVIDEVDSALFDRSRAQHSWEISFTNEFLTAMERFRGLLICTTNRLLDLDSAALRRFTHKVKFDYLCADGNEIFFKQILAPLLRGVLKSDLRQRLAAIRCLTPGDFKTVRDQYAFCPEAERKPLLFIRALEDEARIKALSGAKKPIGF
jgi:SpoVK/Ycf46/Vps4 family AAA+-type ATPase